ncbi:PQQ-dependent sugar dehydrogenase [Cellulomonas sp. URHB0016]
MSAPMPAVRPAPTRHWRRVLALVMAVALLAIVPTGSPASAASPSPVVGVGSGRCLDVNGGSRTPGARVIIYDCKGSSNQSWTLTPAGELTVYDSQTCLDAGQSPARGAAARISACNGSAGQRWRVDADGLITHTSTGLCLDVRGAGTANGTPVIISTCHGLPNQRWTSGFGAPDGVPPTVPANPRVSNLACSSVTFSWDASTDAVGVAYYDVFHDGQLVSTVSGTTLSTTLAVVAGVRWGLYVNARDAAGNVSQASTTVFVTPPQCQVDTTPPTTPTGLVASVSGTTVTLRWTASTDDTGVRAYDVYRGGTKVGTVTGTATVPPGTSFVDSGLAASTAYRYDVVARDGQDNASAHSAAVAVTTGAACGASVCGVTQVGTDNDIPWGLTTLPDGSILYTRRDAHDIVRLDPTTGVRTTAGTVPGVEGTDGEGGLLGLAIAPTFATDHWLYLMLTSATDNRIVRVRYENGALVPSSLQVLLTGILRNKYHNGGRLRFGPDGKLYAATGDAQNGAYAQDIDGLNGKVLRLDPDGSVPSDNPFGNYVWSYGHRNPQGLAFDSRGRLWEQEFGNSVMDETNLITKGGNYGWPACEGTTGTCGTAGYVAPKHTYPTAQGSCSGIAIVRDVLYVACERGARLYRAEISGTSLVNVEAYLTGTYGRLRTVEPAPEGLWLTTTNYGDKDSIAGNSNEKVLRVALGG